MPNVIDSRVQTDCKDFEGLRAGFFEYAQTNFAEVWTDFNTDAFAVVIAELVAYLGNILCYYIDKQTAENFLTTAQLRQSVIDIGKMLDYRLAGPSPASGTIRLTLDPGTFDYLTSIPEGFRVSNGTIVYETAAEVNVTPGALFVDIPAIEGETIRETLLGDGALGTSDGSPAQTFVLNFRNVILSNTERDLPKDIEVRVDNVLYTPVFNLVTAQSNDRVYLVNTNEDFESSITFGNGVFGIIPPAGTDIEATYRVLKTEREENSYGNVNSGTITTLEDSRVGVLSVTNLEKFSGGRQAESIEEARINIPRSLKAGDRAVSFEDFIALAEAFPGVAKAAALRGAGDLDIDLYIAPDGGGSASQALKASIVAHFESRKMIGANIFPRDPVYQPVVLDLRTQASPNNRNIDVKTAQTNALQNLFDFDNLSFGQGIFLKSTGGSDIYDINETLEGVNGVDRIKYNRVTLKPFAYGKRFTNSGVPELLTSNIRQGSSRREFEAVMKTTTPRRTFLLKNKIFGRSTSLNDTRLEDNLRTFLLEFGASTNVAAGQLVDSTKFFVTNQFQFETLIDSAGTHFKILSNTQDTISVSGTPVAGDYQIVKRLEGYILNPNIRQPLTFRILDNDATSVTVDSGLSVVAVTSNSYEIYRYETNKFDPSAYSSTADGVSGSTSFSDSTTIGDGDDFYNDMYVIFQEGPAANIPVRVVDFVDATGTFTHESLGIGIQPNVGDRYVVAPPYHLGVETTVRSVPVPTASLFSGEGFGGEGNDFYNGYVVKFQDGANEGALRKVIDYDDTSNDTLTTNPFPNDPAIGDTFQIAREYQIDDQTVTFALIATNFSSSDIYLFQVSDLVGDLTPRENQILILNPDDLKIDVVGGS